MRPPQLLAFFFVNMLPLLVRVKKLRRFILVKFANTWSGGKFMRPSQLLAFFWKYATSFGQSLEFKKIYVGKIYFQIRGQGVNLCARLSYLLF